MSVAYSMGKAPKTKFQSLDYNAGPGKYEVNFSHKRSDPSYTMGARYLEGNK